ncbi:MAG: trimethylamine methyltransferase family protein, partial [Pseudomonadota bacterium]|nr:trimethylamine methyltransferase family protein [Pseudomonadota bacterium]
AGSTIIIHAAGWLEGGLTVSYEKLVTDMEILQMVAEMCRQPSAEGPAVSLGALAEVAPGGHFFAAEHTMSRYQTEFYEPLVADWSNFGSWTEGGGKTASQRATDIWKSVLADPPDLGHDQARVAAMQDFIAARSAAGGAVPES